MSFSLSLAKARVVATYSSDKENGIFFWLYVFDSQRLGRSDISMSYSDLLKDPRWQKKRLKVLQFDGWMCFGCGSETKQLHAHHVVYKGKPWEDGNEIITQCEDCHKALGPHPKGGIFFTEASDGERSLTVSHCPECGDAENIHKYVTSKGGYVKCGECGYTYHHSQIPDVEVEHE